MFAAKLWLSKFKRVNNLIRVPGQEATCFIHLVACKVDAEIQPGSLNDHLSVSPGPDQGPQAKSSPQPISVWPAS